ncbi:MAG: hypothetical protein ACLVB5_14000 [Christensenellales bacterium]
MAVGRAAQETRGFSGRLPTRWPERPLSSRRTRRKFDVLRRHLHALAQLRGEAVAVREMRRHRLLCARDARRGKASRQGKRHHGYRRNGICASSRYAGGRGIR